VNKCRTLNEAGYRSVVSAGQRCRKVACGTKRAMRQSLLIVVSAPSGAGKTTLCSRLLANVGDMVRSVSCTTRKPRGMEVDGTDYYFISQSEFARRLRRNEFLENAVVHGQKYGTLRKPVEEALAGGKDVLLAIDVQGARQIRDRLTGTDLLKKSFVDIFIVPPAMNVLEERLLTRNEDNPDEIKRRMKIAKQEMKCAGEYMFCVTNDRLDRAYRELKTIILAERKRRSTVV